MLLALSKQLKIRKDAPEKKTLSNGRNSISEYSLYSFHEEMISNS